MTQENKTDWAAKAQWQKLFDEQDKGFALTEAFHEAARKGEIDRMEDYRLQGAKLDSRDENGRTVEEKAQAPVSTSVREWDDIGREVALASIEHELGVRQDVQNYIEQVRPNWNDKTYRYDFKMLR